MNIYLFIILLVEFITHSNETTQEMYIKPRLFLSGPNPDEISDLPYGDITGVSNKIEIWPTPLILFNFQSNIPIESDVKSLVWSAMEEFHASTCIRFEEIQPHANSISIIIENTKKGCHSHLGRSDHSNISLGSECLIKGVIIHQLMHALGFIHENNRPDRDTYVQIHNDNIKPENNRSFDKFNLDAIDLAIPYDYHSIMHSSSFAFAKKPNVNTITSNLGTTHEMGFRTRLSANDINKIRLKYNCSAPYLPVVPIAPIGTPSIVTTTTEKTPIIEICSNVSGNFAHPTDCDKFIVCDNGMEYVITCPNRTVFNPKIGTCDWPMNVPNCNK